MNSSEYSMECFRCGGEISLGTTYVSVNFNIESRHATEDEHMGFIQVEQSEELLRLCKSCGERLVIDDVRNAMLQQLD